MRLLLRGRALELERGRPLLMGIVNASPDSFSDPRARSGDELVDAALELVAEGAALVDVGGESGRTDRAPVPVEEEIERVLPVIGSLARAGAEVSVDTWRAPVAQAAVDAGASMVNDPSGLSDPGVAEVCARSGAALVVTHTLAPPKTKAFPSYDDVVREVADLLGGPAAAARRLGVTHDQLVLDPGIDLAKTPAESVELIRRLEELHALGRPLLVGLSRKDFVGSLTRRAPAGRDAGTLAAVGSVAGAGAHILRVHDVAGAADYLKVRAALDGHAPATDEPLSEELRREPAA